MSENNYKKEAEDFCIAVDEFAKGKLHNAEDLTRITEVIFKEGKQNLLEDVAFSAKYAQGLMKIFQDRSNDFEEEYFRKIKEEYTEAVKKIRESLQEIIDYSNSFIGSIFSDKYLGMTHESMHNLNQLIDDLSWVKVYLNYRKRKD